MNTSWLPGMKPTKEWVSGTLEYSLGGPPGSAPAALDPLVSAPGTLLSSVDLGTL